MRFNLTITDFCQIYNDTFKQLVNDLNIDIDISSDSDLFLSDTHFTKQSSQNKQSGLDMYITSLSLQGINTSIVLYVEPDSNYIVGTLLMANNSHYGTNNTVNTAYTTLINKVFFPSIAKTLDSSIKDPSELLSKLNKNNNYSYINNNILYSLSTSSSSDTLNFSIMAISENKYNELYSTNSMTTNASNNETNSLTSTTSKNVIQNTITNVSNTTNQTSSNNQDTSNVEEFIKDNEKAYTTYYMLQSNQETYSNIYIQLEGNNIYLFDKDLELYFTGTYKSNNGYLVGTYTEVSYNNGGDIIKIECNEELEFEILQNHRLKDMLGYYSYVDGQIMHKNAVYVLD